MKMQSASVKPQVQISVLSKNKALQERVLQEEERACAKAWR
jgi:hypothetical protein